MACTDCTEFLVQGSGTVGSGSSLAFEKVINFYDTDNIPLTVRSVNVLTLDGVPLDDTTPFWVSFSTFTESVLIDGVVTYHLAVTILFDAIALLQDVPGFGEGVYGVRVCARVIDDSKPLVCCSFDLCITGNILAVACAINAAITPSIYSSDSPSLYIFDTSDPEGTYVRIFGLDTVGVAPLVPGDRRYMWQMQIYKDKLYYACEDIGPTSFITIRKMDFSGDNDTLVYTTPVLIIGIQLALNIREIGGVDTFIYNNGGQTRRFDSVNGDVLLVSAGSTELFFQSDTHFYQNAGTTLERRLLSNGSLVTDTGPDPNHGRLGLSLTKVYDGVNAVAGDNTEVRSSDPSSFSFVQVFLRSRSLKVGVGQDSAYCFEPNTNRHYVSCNNASAVNMAVNSYDEAFGDETELLAVSSSGQVEAKQLTENVPVWKRGNNVQFVYYTERTTGEVRKIPPGGRPADEIVLATGLGSGIRHIAYDPITNLLYVCDITLNKIFTVHPVTGATADYITGLSSPYGIAIHPTTGQIFFTATSEVLTVLTGITVPTTLVSGKTNLHGIAIDTVASLLYYCENTDGFIYRSDLAGMGEVVAVVQTQAQTVEPIEDGEYFYFGSDRQSDQIRRRRKNLSLAAENVWTREGSPTNWDKCSQMLADQRGLHIYMVSRDTQTIYRAFHDGTQDISGTTGLTRLRDPGGEVIEGLTLEVSM